MFRFSSYPGILIVFISFILALIGENLLVTRVVFTMVILTFPIMLFFFPKSRNKQDIIGVFGMSLGIIFVTFDHIYLKVLGSVITIPSIIYFSLSQKNTKK